MSSIPRSVSAEKLNTLVQWKKKISNIKMNKSGEIRTESGKRRNALFNLWIE